MNQDVDGNRKLFWKVVSKENGRKVESWSRINFKREMADWHWEIMKHYFENIYNIYTQESVTVHGCGFYGVQRGNDFRREEIGGTEVQEREESLRTERLQIGMRSLERS